MFSQLVPKAKHCFAVHPVKWGVGERMAEKRWAHLRNWLLLAIDIPDYFLVLGGAFQIFLCFACVCWIFCKVTSSVQNI